MNEEYDGVLDNWVVDPMGRNVLWGEIFGDKKGRFNDGAWIHTSRMTPEVIASAKEGVVAKTLNSAYLLGKQGTLDTGYGPSGIL
jgi:hypothetical protein